MSDNDTLYADIVGLTDKRNAFFRRRMSGGEDDVRLGADFHHLYHFRQDFPIIVQHGNAFLFSSFPQIWIGGIQSRHPDAAAQATAGLDCLLCGKGIYLVAMYPVNSKTSEKLRTQQSITENICTDLAPEKNGL